MRIGVAACATSISDGTGLMIFSNFFPGKLVALIVAANRALEETFLLFLFANNKTLRDVVVLVDDDDVPQQTPLVRDDFAILNTACCALMYFSTKKKTKENGRFIKSREKGVIFVGAIHDDLKER